MNIFDLESGSRPLVISVPHAGTEIPEDIRTGMSDEALVLTDTDWHVDRLYDFAAEMDVSILKANTSRYVIDLNRPADGSVLYPGQTETALCPIETFADEPLYKANANPETAEIDRRRVAYWQPYHDALEGELARLKSIHGSVRLWDAHSIADHVPRLFEGKLPDLNFGTNGGLACHAPLSAKLEEIADRQSSYSHVLNGRFKGGYITRHYGQPQQGVEAVQLELSQATYMDQAFPFDYREDLAAQVRPLLQLLIEAMI